MNKFLGMLLFFLLSVNNVLYAYPPIGYQAVPRDAFPVFDNPTLISGDEAEKEGYIYESDAVIGVYQNGEAKAYPVTIMGVHELGNDVLGGIPIAVSW